MDYEKKYKESVEKLRYKITDNNGSIDYKAIVIVDELQDIFPELCESEDERIRKAIVEALNSHCNSINILSARGYQMEDIEAWLEKQGEQKHAEWSKEDEHRRKDAIYFLESAKRHYADTSEIEKSIDWLKSLPERFNLQPKQNVNDMITPNKKFFLTKDFFLRQHLQFRKLSDKLLKWQRLLSTILYTLQKC